MKISNKQILMLMQILEDTLIFGDTAASHFSFDHKIRCDLYNALLNQQSDELVQIGN